MLSITSILQKIETGDPVAANELLPLVYGELRQMAAAQMAQERPGQTLQATGLVHEAYLRLVGKDGSAAFSSRRHFFGAAAEAMRRIRVDNARRKKREKHGGDRERLELGPDAGMQPAPDERLLALDDALIRFAAHSPEKSELLKLRWFVGMSLDEAASIIGISPSTADRWWSYARAWLRVEVEPEENSD